MPVRVCNVRVEITMSSKAKQRIAIIVGVIALIALFKIFELDRYFSLSYIKSSQESFAALYAQHRVLVIASYMLIYIVATALSLPGAAVLTLAGGALFGLLVGTIVISFASTAGATLACFFPAFCCGIGYRTGSGINLKP